MNRKSKSEINGKHDNTWKSFSTWERKKDNCWGWGVLGKDRTRKKKKGKGEEEGKNNQ